MAKTNRDQNLIENIGADGGGRRVLPLILREYGAQQFALLISMYFVSNYLLLIIGN